MRYALYQVLSRTDESGAALPKGHEPLTLLVTFPDRPRAMKGRDRLARAVGANNLRLEELPHSIPAPFHTTRRALVLMKLQRHLERFKAAHDGRGELHDPRGCKRCRNLGRRQ
jgi:hypothetical protein